MDRDINTMMSKKKHYPRNNNTKPTQDLGTIPKEAKMDKSTLTESKSSSLFGSTTRKNERLTIAYDFSTNVKTLLRVISMQPLQFRYI